MINTPCRNCNDRNAECHCTCEKYIEWKNELAKVKENVARERELDLGVKDNFLNRRYKYLRKINKDK